MRKLSLEKEMRKKINKEKQLELFLEGIKERSNK